MNLSDIPYNTMSAMFNNSFGKSASQTNINSKIVDEQTIYNLDTIAFIFSRNENNQIVYKKIQHDFLGSEISDGNKLIYIVDTYHAEFIYTNNKFSISCFFKQSKSLEYIVSKAKLAFITGCEFDPNEWYDIYKLGFFANVYSIELPRINHIIRKYDDMIMDTWGLKCVIDSDFVSAIDDIYDVLDKCSTEFARQIVCYDPNHVRKAVKTTSLPNGVVDKFRVGKTNIIIHNEYQQTTEMPPRSMSASTLIRHRPTPRTIEDDFVVV